MTTEFVTKDSGNHETYASGARRDTQKGKGRYDLIPRAAIHRLAQLFERGAEKYEPRNWEKGIPFSRLISSLLRHAFQYLAGERDEDHLAAVAWNAFALMHFEEGISQGISPASLNDLAAPVWPIPVYSWMPLTDKTQISKSMFSRIPPDEFVTPKDMETRKDMETPNNCPISYREMVRQIQTTPPLLVYISGPFSASDPAQVKNNVDMAKWVSSRLWFLNYSVICPHANTEFVDQYFDLQWHEYLRGDLVQLEKTDFLMVLPGWENSKGTKWEIEYALELKIPVLYWKPEYNTLSAVQLHVEIQRNYREQIPG